MRLALALRLGAAAAASFAAPAAAQMPWSADGRLEESDPVANDYRYDEHRVRLEAGQRYRIAAASDDFDTLIRLYGPGGAGEPLAENDDSGGSLNSRINYTPRESGEYVLRVTSFSQEGRGAYTASAEVQPPLPPPDSSPGTAVAASGTWSLWQGSLGPADADREGYHYDDYLVRFDGGRPHIVSLEADGFDAVVQILPLAGRDAESAEAVDGDDDAGTGLNAMLAFLPEQGGEYIVRVTSYEEGAAGSYRLWISR